MEESNDTNVDGGLTGEQVLDGGQGQAVVQTTGSESNSLPEAPVLSMSPIAAIDASVDEEQVASAVMKRKRVTKKMKQWQKKNGQKFVNDDVNIWLRVEPADILEFDEFRKQRYGNKRLRKLKLDKSKRFLKVTMIESAEFEKYRRENDERVQDEDDTPINLMNVVDEEVIEEDVEIFELDEDLARERRDLERAEETLRLKEREAEDLEYSLLLLTNATRENQEEPWMKRRCAEVNQILAEKTKAKERNEKEKRWKISEQVRLDGMLVEQLVVDEEEGEEEQEQVEDDDDEDYEYKPVAKRRACRKRKQRYQEKVVESFEEEEDYAGSRQRQRVTPLNRQVERASSKESSGKVGQQHDYPGWEAFLKGMVQTGKEKKAKKSKDNGLAGDQKNKEVESETDSDHEHILQVTLNRFRFSQGAIDIPQEELQYNTKQRKEKRRENRESEDE